MRAFALLLMLLWAPARAEPDVPKTAVLDPTFMSGFGSFSGGTAFLCRVEQLNVDLLLTAHHLFGPACGHQREYKWNEVGRIYPVVTGLCMEDFSQVVTSVENLPIPGAVGISQIGYEKDIAAWHVPAACKLPRLKTAASPCAVGDTVYLLGRLVDQMEPRFYQAKVTRVSETELEYVYAGAVANLRGTSGAPLLNEAGEVVAINIGGYQQDSATIGIGNQLPSMLKLLRTALDEQRKETARR